MNTNDSCSTSDNETETVIEVEIDPPTPRLKTNPRKNIRSMFDTLSFPVQMTIVGVTGFVLGFALLTLHDYLTDTNSNSTGGSGDIIDSRLGQHSLQ